MKSRCLFCYKEVEDGVDYHSGCAKKLFGTPRVPVIPYTRDNIENLALQVLETSTSITGVQPKLSLDINRGGKNEPDKLTIVGLWGNYILKPQSSTYNEMPELEDLTMKLAEIAGIATAKHGLIRMADGEFAYITRRMDRGADGEKYSMLDMCQLTNRLTEHKYLGTYLQLAETVKNYSISPMLDVQRFWEIVIFSWITGNSDMHCKNFSLIDDKGIGYQLSPAYDLLAVLLTGIEDNDEMAMPLIGSVVNDNRIISGFTGEMFNEAMVKSGISEKVAQKILHKFTKCREKWNEIIEVSFLSKCKKEEYRRLIEDRLNRIQC